MKGMTMKGLGILLAAVATVCAGSAEAMTYAEFKSAIENAEDGATVYLQNDVEYDSALPLTAQKSVTLASPEGDTFVLRRKDSYKNALISMARPDMTPEVTFRNIIIDGNKETSNTGRFLYITNGVVTLDAGTVLRNFNSGNTAGPIQLCRAGRLVMNAGAEIRDCDYANWAFICIGATPPNRGGTFQMNGGLITGCHGGYGTRNPTYDGLVYVYQEGIFDMRGGLITGNVSDNCTAGVDVYSGTMYLSGDACITNNHGGIANDIYLYGSGLRISNYTGRATCWFGTTAGAQTVPNVGDKSVKTWRMVSGEIATGLGGVSCQGHPELVLDGYKVKSGSDTYWRLVTSEIVGGGASAYIEESMAEVADGGTILLKRDFTNSVLKVDNGKTMTFGSDANGPYVLIRTNDTSLVTVRNGSTARFENLIIDGNKDGVGEASTLIYASTGTVVLASGAIVRNAKSTGTGSGATNKNGPSVMNVGGSGTKLVMEEGSEIRDCEMSAAGSWGTVIRIGGTTECDVPPRFEMKGGRITGCTSRCTSGAGGGYGGTVYVQKGTFEMTGGEITGNSCDGSCAGVQAYQGTTRISGTARICGNTGTNPDLYSSGGNMKMFGDFRGRVGISSGNQGEGDETKVIVEEGATGAWGFFPAANSVTADLVGTPNAAGDKVMWAAATGWIDGDGVASADDATLVWTDRTLTLSEKDRAAMPHVLKGSALAANGSITFDFDAEGLKKAAFLPLEILSAEDGVFTGEWSFTLPQARRGEWFVAPRRTADGVVGYVLGYRPSGLLIMVN